MKRTIINPNEFATAADHSSHGVHAVEMVRNLTDGVAGWPAHYSRVTVSQQAATTARINPGRLFVGDTLYDLDDAFNVPLLDRVATSPGDTVWIALILRGLVVTDQAIRTRRVSIDPPVNEAQSGDKTVRYTIECVPQSGVAGPTPLKPVTATNTCVVAWVLLSTTQIVNIEMNAPHRAKTVYEVEGRLTIVEGRIDALLETTNTLRGDVVGLTRRLENLPSPDITFQLQRRVAGLSRHVNPTIEGEPFSAFFDNGLDRSATTGKWDLSHPESNVRIWQGIRHPYAATSQARIELYNPANPDVTVTGGVCLPKWTAQPILTVSAGDGAGVEDIADQEVQEVQTIQYMVSMSSTSYGPSFNFCENALEYQGAQNRQVGDTFSAGNRSIAITGVADVEHNRVQPPEVLREHTVFTGHEVITNTWSEPRWRYVTQTYSFNGNHLGQTWLNNQHVYVVGYDIHFARVSGSGAVSLTACETDRTGAPLVKKALETVAVAHNALTTGPVRFSHRPAYYEPGRFAWWLSTPGNHAVQKVSDNKFAEGSMFRFTDGIWATPSAREDLTFTVYGARFEATRTIVPMKSVTLESGMSEIQIRYAGSRPPQTELSWEIRTQEGEWAGLRDSGVTSPLMNRPVTVELRAIFVGTTAVQPSITLDADAVVVASRPATSMVAVSKVHNFGASFTNFYAEMLVDAWDAALHAGTLRMIVGTTTVTPHTTWTEPDFVNPRKVRIKAKFTLGAPASSGRLRLTLSSTTASRVAFIDNCEMRGIN
ncbi:MAG: hypothetical protein ACRDBL_09025 [Rhabdaerophilum sp.]